MRDTITFKAFCLEQYKYEHDMSGIRIAFDIEAVNKTVNNYMSGDATAICHLRPRIFRCV